MPAPPETSSLARGLATLQVLASHEALTTGGLGVTRIAALLGREKTQVSRALRVLDDAGFVERDPETLNYRLGWELFALAARAGDERLLVAAPAVLSQLMATLGETVHLSVLRGDEVLTLLCERPPHAVAAQDWIGRRVPVHCTSSGHALMLDHDRPALDLLLGERALNGGTHAAPRSAAQLHRRLLQARERGFAVADEEFEPGLVAVAAPVRDARGRIVAAIDLSAPKFRFGDHLNNAGTATRRAADTLSERLGVPVPRTRAAI